MTHDQKKILEKITQLFDKKKLKFTFYKSNDLIKTEERDSDEE